MTSPSIVTLGDFTLEAFAARLREHLGDGEVVVGPFGEVMGPLFDPEHPVWGGAPQTSLVWTRPEAAVPAFARLVDGETVDFDALLDGVDEFAAAIAFAAGRAPVLVASWVLPPSRRGLGLLDWQAPHGLRRALAAMNVRLAERVDAVPGAYLLDAGRWLAMGGAKAESPRLWFRAKVPFTATVFDAAAADVDAALRALAGRAKKLVVLDLDNTLWGGILGDDGIEGLRLGGHDPVGEAFVAFQRALKALQRRGVALAILSKNEEATAIRAIEEHDAMVLRRSDFAGWRINWHDKASNLVDLVGEINVGLDAVVFIDDNPAERGRVQEALPEVLVPDWPVDPQLYVRALAALDVFDMPALSSEDRQRGAMYAAERLRRETRRDLGSHDEWLTGLDVRVTVERLVAANRRRVAQLLNKTNQFNLTTRRLPEAALVAWVAGDGREFLVFRVADRFGDSGIVGLCSLEPCTSEPGEPASVPLVDFVLSCRVFGRGVEQAMLAAAMAVARAAGAERLVAEYRPTAKNEPTLRFLEGSGAARSGSTFWWTGPIATPPHIQMLDTSRNPDNE